MGRLISMNLFRMRKSKMFWVSAIIFFVVGILLPIIIKITANVLYEIVKNSNDAQSVMEAKELVELNNQPAAFSGVLRAMFGGAGPMLILALVCAASFMFADLGHGYIKNIAGRFPNKWVLAFPKYLVAMIQSVIFVLVSILGTIVGLLATRGIEFDRFIPEALLEFLVKLLLLCAMVSIVFFFTVGLRNKGLGIVMGVFMGTSALYVITLPLQLIINSVLKIDFKFEDYIPDYQFQLTDINLTRNVIISLVCIAIFLPSALALSNSQDVK